MSIYAINKVKEQAENKMKEDLKEKGYSINDMDYFKTEEYYNEFYTLNKEEVNQYLILRNIVNDIDKWHFYTSDAIYFEFIKGDKELETIEEHLGIEESLEVAKNNQLITGFFYIGGDLWMVGEEEWY